MTKTKKGGKGSEDHFHFPIKQQDKEREPSFSQKYISQDIWPVYSKPPSLCLVICHIFGY